MPENWSNISNAKSTTKLFIKLINISKIKPQKNQIVYIDGNYNIFLIYKDIVIMFEIFFTKIFKIFGES